MLSVAFTEREREKERKRDSKTGKREREREKKGPLCSIFAFRWERERTVCLCFFSFFSSFILIDCGALSARPSLFSLSLFYSVCFLSSFSLPLSLFLVFSPLSLYSLSLSADVFFRDHDRAFIHPLDERVRTPGGRTTKYEDKREDNSERIENLERAEKGQSDDIFFSYSKKE